MSSHPYTTILGGTKAFSGLNVVPVELKFIYTHHVLASVKYSQSVKVTQVISPFAFKFQINVESLKRPSLSLYTLHVLSYPSNFRFTAHTVFVFSTLHSRSVLYKKPPLHVLLSKLPVKVIGAPSLPNTRYCPSVSVPVCVPFAHTKSVSTETVRIDPECTD